ncbi:hypothetical protein H310_08548 [Aphanomyces invadans]|uniref:MYND-type domain-containing protein n=1 Tax=Aphanomyces invadans TaxID=157072 RepID=A0A024TYS0_9STRA|nr:hypothetical protein H310_08548 [Aphanomyces invadans]ETV99144.1 hypothetical protein H310_08548 [Aphanomyces invadans]|eukprot:XP_008872572.1 hypothetical protein H310_08548 [Aphanomyces invadans]
MADSDSDDELMRALQGHSQPRECAYCKTDGATFPCTKCNSVVYCDDGCLRRHFKAHRDHCIKVYLKEESESESDEEEEEEEEEEDEEKTNDLLNRRKSGRGSVLMRGSSQAFHNSGMLIPGLTEEQIAQLVKLSSKSTDVLKSSKEISSLKAQLEEMMKSQVNMQELAGRMSTMQLAQPVSSQVLQKSSSLKQKELEKLMQKLEALEKRANFASAAVPPASSSMMPMSMPSMMMAPPPPLPPQVVVYTPLLVKDDDKFKKYFKLLKMAMPVDQIKAKMEVEGVSPALLDTPNAVSPNDPGAPPGAYIPLTVGEDPKFKKYFKLQAMHMPIDQIKMKMEAEGLDPDLLDHPEKISPNDPGPPAQPIAPAGAYAFSGVVPVAAATPPPYTPLLVKDDTAFKKYFKLLSMGMPKEQVALKMKAEGLNADVLETPDGVSPNDPGPPPPQPATPPLIGGGSVGGVSMEQLFAMVMHHQQMIESGAAGGGGGGGMRSPSHPDEGSSPVPVRSVKDQMAAELAAASDAVHDIFGEDTVKASGGGMTMVEQLEKKARKESNKKLVDNIDAINATIHDLLTMQFKSEAHAVQYAGEVSKKLEAFGLTLGVDANQTWSARLLIKNKDTRDWYFSEQQRLDAGNAYLRLWSLSTLANDASQMIQKYDQIVNAPVVLAAQTKNKVEVIDKFTNLLKDAVKLKHKIFKNKTYQDELTRMSTLKIPQEYDKHGDQLIDAAAILATAALDFADEELRVLEKTVRAKKIRASTTVHVGEKAVQLVGIVNKLGARGMDAVNTRVGPLEAQLKAIKDEFFADKDEEEEDDVL